MKLKLVQKIALLPIITAVVLLLLMLFSNYYGQSDTLEQSEGKRIATAANIFWQAVDRDALANEELLTILTADDRLVDKMLSGDREGFLAMAKPIFSNLKSKYDITHFYAIDKTGRVFLRVHNPPQYGDLLKRATYLQASSTGGVGKGIEMGKKFYSLRVVMPIKRNGEVVGYFELGEELFHLVKGFTANSTATISMWVTDAYAQENKIAEVFKAVGDWHLVMSSDEAQQTEFMTKMGPLLKQGMEVSTHLQYDGQDWFVRTFPFKDAFGKTAGVITVGTDTSAMHSRISKFMGTVLVLAIIVLLIAVVVSLWLSRAVTRPINQVNDMLKDISAGEGDLTRRLHITSKDEVGEVAANFNAFVEKLQGTITQVKHTLVELVEGVRGMSDVIHGTNDMMSEQRKETDLVASSINEMTATIQDVARNANEAATKAREADESAAQGQDVVNQTVSAIRNLASEVEASTSVVEELSKESENIGAVLDVIKNIAEQTNLLALNAAIEAARAGEQGRGFAVVADEVRTLAQRTQESTHEIETMIQSLQQRTTNAVGAMSGSREHAHKSVEMAGQASVALSTISEAVAAISSMNTQTATATEEQTSVAHEVDRNIVNIRQVTEDVSSNAEHSMESSQRLVALCDNIEGLVGQFKV